MTCSLQPYLFLDRDGTIIVERDYLSDADQVQLESGAINGLTRFAAAGFRLVVVSNQSGLARGIFDEKALAAVTARLDGLLRSEGIDIASWHHCPHGAGDGCKCRKPLPGMLDEAAALGLPGRPVDWAASIIVGDKATDVAAGLARGCRAALVTTGHGMIDAERMRTDGVMVCADLAEVAKAFLGP